MRRIGTFPVLLLGFVLLGMGASIPGVAWPSIAEDLERPIAQLGLLSLAYGLGYTVSALLSGILAKRYRIVLILTVAAGGASIALFGIAVSPQWVVLLLAMVMFGLMAGSTDSTVNTYVAIRRGARSMGVLHGTFGIGAILGPLLVTGLLGAGFSWRASFLALAIGQLAVLTGLVLFARSASVPVQESARGVNGVRVTGTLVWSLLVFFVYAGVAAGAGVWAFTYLTEFRGFGSAAGGIAVAAYWGGFTASRLLLGVVGDRFDHNTTLRLSNVFTILGVAALWWSPSVTIAVGALVFTGFAHGPVFPLEILLSPGRFGTRHTATVVGFEIASANVGFAVLPALIGVLVARFDLGVVPPALLVIATLLLIAVEMLRRSSESEARVATV